MTYNFARLKEVMRVHRWTFRTLAGALGTDEQKLQKIFDRKMPADRDLMRRVCNLVSDDRLDIAEFEITEFVA